MRLRQYEFNGVNMATTTSTITLSVNGSLLKVGSTAKLVTSAGTWTFSKTTATGGAQILLNGKSAAGGAATMLEVGNGGVLYAKNSAGKWYKWSSGGWPVVSNPNVIKVSAASLTVSKGAAATSIKIAAPTDSIYSASQLKVAVTALPTDGAVLLSTGGAVTKGQALTVAQLTGLKFKPTSTLTSGSSTFTYRVTDPAGTVASGSAKLAIATSISPTGTVTPPPGYTASQLVGQDKFTTASLDSSKWNPWLGQNGARWAGGGIPLPAPFSSETLAVSPYNAEYYDPYPYASATSTTGQHLTGGSGLNITASPSTHFSAKSGIYKWASATISSTGHKSMILPATGGYVQITAKIPDSSHGAWPFFWFLGEGSNRTQNVDWEFGYSKSPNSAMALGINDKTVATPIASVDLSQGYHTYGTKYVPGKSYTFYLDNKQVATAPTTNTGAFELTIGLQMATSKASGWHTVADPVNHRGPYVLAIKDVQVYHA
jgi:Ni,Fe-hydrogenase III small subunit